MRTANNSLGFPAAAFLATVFLLALVVLLLGMLMSVRYESTHCSQVRRKNMPRHGFGARLRRGVHGRQTRRTALTPP
ncbi:MAG: hypothetical protein Q8K85_15530 [Hyphomicrobium sp.]|nr:hypothetical protein [Hyphomicrobium sp.]